MIGMGRIQTRALPTALVALILVSASQAQSTLDFGFYPKGSQDCLTRAAESSKCESATVAATNSCLCRNGGAFIITVAACLGRSSRGDINTVYTTMKDACNNSETPISVTEAEFMEAANTATSTSTQPTSTASTTVSGTTAAATTTTALSETSPPGGGRQGGLTTGAIAGIATGASIAGLALLGGLIYFLLRRRRKMGEESHPMLPQQAQMAGRDSSAYYSRLPDTGGWPKKDRGPPPESSIRHSGFNWESPAHLSYPGSGALAPSPPLPAQELDGGEPHPTGTPAAPAEMGGTPVVATPPANGQFRPYKPGQGYPGSG